MLLNSTELSPCISLNKFESLLLIFSSLLCLINSHFLITKCLNLNVLCKEKSGVNNGLGLRAHQSLVFMSIGHLNKCVKHYNYENALPIFFCQVISGSSSILERE